ncbi:MAG: HD domain-containing protein [Deltaproteobacteria bacterium]|nr:HD domain-containing protein [Deltaproteobacteria bacterium]
MEKKIFVKDLVEGQDATIPLFVAAKSLQKTKVGAPYLTLSLADSSGTISGKVWDDPLGMDKKLVKGRVSIVNGQVGNFNGRRQISVRSAALLDEGDFDPNDYQSLSGKSEKIMRDELFKLASSVKDPDFRALTLKILNHEKLEPFYRMPAAKSFHHACGGGLLEHTLSVARLAAFCADHYGGVVNRSLLLAGAILHDIGKTWEFTQGPGTDYTTKGRLMGHLCMGSEFVSETAAGIPGFPAEKLVLLQHLLLSHHGEFAMGTAVTPKILEAVLLHQLDNLDAKLRGISDFIQKETQPQGDGTRPEWTGFFKLLESYYMRTPLLGDEGPKSLYPEEEEPLAPEKGAPALPGEPTPFGAPVAEPETDSGHPALGTPLEEPPLRPVPDPGPAASGAAAEGPAPALGEFDATGGNRGSVGRLDSSGAFPFMDDSGKTIDTGKSPDDSPRARKRAGGAGVGGGEAGNAGGARSGNGQKESAFGAKKTLF